MTTSALKQQNFGLINLAGEGGKSKLTSSFLSAQNNLPQLKSGTIALAQSNSEIPANTQPSDWQKEWAFWGNKLPSPAAFSLGFLSGVPGYVLDVGKLVGNLGNAIIHPRSTMDAIGKAFQEVTKDPSVTKALGGLVDFVGKLTGGPFLDAAQAARDGKHFEAGAITCKHIIDLGLMIYGPGLLKNFAQKLPLLIKAAKTGKLEQLARAAKTKRPKLAVGHGRIALAEKKARTAGVVAGAGTVAVQNASIAQPSQRVSDSKIIQIISQNKLGNNRITKQIKGRTVIPQGVTGRILGSPIGVEGFKISSGLDLAVSKGGSIYNLAKVDEIFLDPNGLITYNNKSFYTTLSKSGGSSSSGARPNNLIKLKPNQDIRKVLQDNGFKEIAPNHMGRDGRGFILDAKGKFIGFIDKQINLSGAKLKIINVSGSQNNMIITYRGGLIQTITKDSEGYLKYKLSDLKNMPSFGATGIKKLTATPLSSESPANLARIEANMRPEHSGSDNGFLAQHENLAKLLENDAATLTRNGVTAPQLANIMKMFETIAKLGGENGVKVTFNNRTYTVGVSSSFRGGVNNPITGQYSYQSATNYFVKETGSNTRIVFNGLEPELIAKGFFQGVSSTHRTNPEALIRFLEAGQPTENLKTAIKKMGL
jgi:hypothetical protein